MQSHQGFKRCVVRLESCLLAHPKTDRVATECFGWIPFILGRPGKLIVFACVVYKYGCNSWSEGPCAVLTVVKSPRGSSMRPFDLHTGGWHTALVFFGKVSKYWNAIRELFNLPCWELIQYKWAMIFIVNCSGQLRILGEFLCETAAIVQRKQQYQNGFSLHSPER